MDICSIFVAGLNDSYMLSIKFSFSTSHNKEQATSSNELTINECMKLYNNPN